VKEVISKGQIVYFTKNREIW